MAGLKQKVSVAHKKTLKDTPDPSSLKKPPVFTWAFKSSKPLAGGAMVTYITRLNDDCSVSCDCLGWRFVRNGKPRSCKHTKNPAVVNEAVEIYEKWKRGETLPIITDEMAAVYLAPSTKTPEKQAPVVTFGRVLELD